MGSGSSTLGLSPSQGQYYADKSLAAKNLSNDILTMFFKNTNYQDLLSLSNLSSCSKYIFTTADALKTVFKEIQIYPQRGKDGKFLFAPISSLSFKDTKGAPEDIIKRNTICVDVAYYYIRTFQIYSALALTVMDTNPSNIIPNISAQALKNKDWLGFGGGTISAPIIKLIENTPLEPLQKVFRQGRKNNAYQNFLVMDEDPSLKYTGNLYIYLIDVGRFGDTIDIEASYILKDQASKNDLRVILNKTERGILLSFNMNNSLTPIQEFSKTRIGWDFLYDDGSHISTENPAARVKFFQNVHEYFKSDLNDPRAINIGRNPSQYAQQFTSTQMEKSAYADLMDIKNKFDAYSKGDARGNISFLKSYAIARFMTLAQPIFRDPRYKGVITSQICKTAYNFEVDKQMPRSGSTPKDCIYLKSLVGLYYDEYELKPNKTELTFKKSEPGNNQLEVASTTLAKLYGVGSKKTERDPDPRTFLESRIPFVVSDLCKNNSFDIPLNTITVGKLMNEVLLPLLKLQERHTDQVNNLLKKMFNVKKDTAGNVSMSFQPYLNNGGIPAVNQFGVMARNLLLQYYFNAETLFVKGVDIIEIFNKQQQAQQAQQAQQGPKKSSWTF